MKFKNLKIIFFSQFLALIFFAPFLTMAQTDEITWNYPVHYGTEEWSQLNSFSERLNAFNIPNEILTKMTTGNLVKTCLKYPWWILITSRDNNQAGYDYLKSVFNGFRELENRKDAGKELLMVYKQLNPEKRLEFKTSVEKGKFSYQFVLIETILSQPNILENLTTEDLTQLLGVANSIFRNKSNPIINYSLFSLSSTGLLQVRILEKCNKDKLLKIKEEFPKFERFVNEGITDDRNMLIKICNAADEHFKSL